MYIPTNKKGCSFHMSHSLTSPYYFPKAKRMKITTAYEINDKTLMDCDVWQDKKFLPAERKGRVYDHASPDAELAWHVNRFNWTNRVKTQPPSFSVSNALRSRVHKKKPKYKLSECFSCRLHRHWNHLMSQSARKSTGYAVLLKSIKIIVLSLTVTQSSWHSVVILSWPFSCAIEAVKQERLKNGRI
jgi:hypothetical protein